MVRGNFITFEGCEGVGKSTQITRLAEYLNVIGQNVIVTREPGGTLGAEKIRELLVTGCCERWDAITEALLNFAARRDHVERIIRPALKTGQWVICDRFADSTTAYQGYAGGMTQADIKLLYSISIGSLKPDLTFIIDVPVDISLMRIQARHGVEDRYERMDRTFHENLRQGFLNIAQKNSERCVVIDGNRNIDQVTEEIQMILLDRLALAP